MSVNNRSKYGSTMRSTQSTFQTSLYATPFILDRDISNRWKCIEKVEKTSPFTNSIPFLREPEIEWKNVTKSPSRSQKAHSQGPNNTFTAGFNHTGSQSLLPTKKRLR